MVFIKQFNFDKSYFFVLVKSTCRHRLRCLSSITCQGAVQRRRGRYGVKNLFRKKEKTSQFLPSHILYF